MAVVKTSYKKLTISHTRPSLRAVEPKEVDNKHEKKDLSTSPNFNSDTLPSWQKRLTHSPGAQDFAGRGSPSQQKEEENDNSTWCSQAVSHPSTNQAQRCLTSVIGRELVFST